MTDAPISFRIPYTRPLQREQGVVVDMEGRRDGALVPPVSGTYTLTAPDGTVLVDARAIVVASDIATCTLTSSDLPSTLAFGDGYVEDWSLVYGDGTTETPQRLATLVRRRLYPSLTDEDLLDEWSDLNRYLGTLTSWQRFRDRAWKDIILTLEARGDYPHLVMNAQAFTKAHRHLTFAKIYRWMDRGARDAVWADHARDEMQEYRDAWEKITFVTDRDNDGVPDDGRGDSAAVIHLNAAPKSSLPGWA